MTGQHGAVATPGGPADEDALHLGDDAVSLELRAGDPTFTCSACGDTTTITGGWSQSKVDAWTAQHQAPVLTSWTVRAGNQVIDTVTPPRRTSRSREGQVWPPPPPST